MYDGQLQSTSAKLIPKERRGRVDLRISTPRYTPTHSGLQYLGRTIGFGTDLEPVVSDQFVEDAILDLVGEIPADLQGYTRSFASLDRLYEGLSRYDIEPTFLDFSQELRTALTLAWQAFHIPGGVYPKQPEEVRFEGTASAGWSWAGKKKAQVKDSAIQEAYKLKRLNKKHRLDKRSLPPCMCFKRTQLAESTKPKVRTVWGYPFELTLLEGQYAQPLIDAYAKRESPMFIGRTAFKQLPIFIDGLFLYGDACGIDWSGFDAVHGRIIIHEAFQALASNLWLTEEEADELLLLEYYFVNTPVVMPDGYMYIKHIGIPSGSFFTQLIGSFINFVCIMTLMLTHWKGVWTKIKVLSDDSVFTVPILQDEHGNRIGNVMDLELWANSAKQLFGLTMNLKKTFLASRPEELEFLGRSSTVGSGTRDELRLLRLALYPEYRVESPDVAVSRVRGILLDSGFKSWKMLDLYDYMVEKYGPDAAASRDKKWKYIAQQDVPSGRVRMTKLWAIGS